MLTNKYYGLSLLDENNEYIFFSNNTVRGPAFYLKHGTEYKILITNQSMCRANAHIFVDGKEIGSFRIKSNEKIIIERPAGINDQKKRKFTFFDILSKEAKMGQIKNSSELGKLVVKIEKEKLTNVETDNTRSVDCVDGVGGTALGRYSNQRFEYAPYMLTDNNVIYLEASMLLLEDSKIIPL
jgi:hypothetical protein